MKLTRDKIILILLVLMVFAVAGGLYLGGQHTARPEDAVKEIVTDFFSSLSEGNLARARGFLVKDKRETLKAPYSALSEAVYREFSLISVENVVADGENAWLADVNLRLLDTLPIMTKADFMFFESLAQQPDLDDQAQDALLEKIYEDLLARDDLPFQEKFALVSVCLEDNALRIDPDENFCSVLEGNITKNLSAMQTLMQAAVSVISTADRPDAE